MIRKIVVRTLLVGLLIAAALVFLLRFGGGLGAGLAERYFSTSYQTECQFIVETVISDLVGMYSYAGTGQLPDSKKFSVQAIELSESTWREPVYQVEIKGIGPTLKIKLPVTDPIWSPQTYEPVASALARAFPKVVASPAGDLMDARLLRKLSFLTGPTLEMENGLLSAQLESDFKNPTLHGQAALLLGAFGFRENAGDFQDVRYTLCRMAAHLVFARALSPDAEKELNWRYANIIQLTLMNNQAQALGLLNELSQSPESVPSWNKALYARNTGDYRVFEKEPPSSLLEQVEYFRSLCVSVHAVSAVEKFKEMDFAGIPDWYWAVFSENYSVGLGHWCLANSLKMEMQEIAGVYKVGRQRELTSAELVDALNVMPELLVENDGGGGIRLRIIDWGQWAMQFQRHLGLILVEDYVFMNDHWGVPENAAAFRAQVGPVFGGMRLFPFVRRQIGGDEKEYHSAVDDAYKVTVASPQLVSPGIWNQLCYKVEYAPFYQPNPNPHINEWHNHNPPPFTAYNPFPRFNHPSLTGHPDSLECIEKMHQLAPYDEVICRNLMRIKFGKNPSAEQVNEVCGMLLPFSAWANYTLAQSLSKDPEAYEQAMNKAAEIRPMYYYTLADYWHERGDEEKRVYYTEQGMAKWPESLAKASEAEWLAKYYLDHGDLVRANQLAAFGAEVYSYAGLEGAGKIQEAQGNFADAEDFFKKIKERYNDSGPLVAFYVRQQKRDGSAAYEELIQEESKAVFPDGLRKVAVADFSDAPKDGAFIAEDSDESLKAGLSKGDVVVALDGYEVHNFKQYSYVRGLSGDEEPMRLIVWKSGTYAEITANPPQRKFGINMPDYKAE